MYKRILVALDGSETSQAALAEALNLARETPASTLRVVTIIDVPAGVLTAEGANEVSVERSLRETADRILAEASATARAGGLEPETGVGECFGGSVAEVILDVARRWNADLIIVGTHGRRGWRRMILGSVAEGVARSADRPVLLVHHPEKRATGPGVAPASS